MCSAISPTSATETSTTCRVWGASRSRRSSSSASRTEPRHARGRRPARGNRRQRARRALRGRPHELRGGAGAVRRRRRGRSCARWPPDVAHPALAGEGRLEADRDRRGGRRRRRSWPQARHSHCSRGGDDEAHPRATTPAPTGANEPLLPARGRLRRSAPNGCSMTDPLHLEAGLPRDPVPRRDGDHHGLRNRTSRARTGRSSRARAWPSTWARSRCSGGYKLWSAKVAAMDGDPPGNDTTVQTATPTGTKCD